MIERHGLIGRGGISDRERSLCKGLEHSSLPSLLDHALLFWMLSLGSFPVILFFQAFTCILLLTPLNSLSLHNLTISHHLSAKDMFLSSQLLTTYFTASSISLFQGLKGTCNTHEPCTECLFQGSCLCTWHRQPAAHPHDRVSLTPPPLSPPTWVITKA